MTNNKKLKHILFETNEPVEPAAAEPGSI